MRASPLEAEVVVVGGGAAGAIAALAARRAGRTVALVRRAFGATAVSSGAADVARDPLATPSAPRGERSSILACAEALASRRPDHPYAILAGELTRFDEALSFSAEVSGGLLAFAKVAEENHYLISPLGMLKATAGGLATIAAGALHADVGELGIVALVGHPTLDPGPYLGALDEGLHRAGLDARVRRVRCSYLTQRDDALLRPHELAQRLVSERQLARLAETIRRELAGARPGLLLLPPILPGDGRDALTTLGSLLELPCAELPALPPSVPGLRLQRALDAKLAHAQVELVAGEVRVENGTLTLFDSSPQLLPPERFDPGAVVPKPAARSARPIATRALVLATGKLLGGGVRREGGRLIESVLGLPIVVSERRSAADNVLALTSAELVSDQPLFRAGVAFDAQLRPLDGRGEAPFARVFACGGLLAGNDPAQDGAGLGLALFSGYLAGRHAANAAREEGTWAS